MGVTNEWACQNCISCKKDAFQALFSFDAMLKYAFQYCKGVSEWNKGRGLPLITALYKHFGAINKKEVIFVSKKLLRGNLNVEMRVLLP